MVVRFAERQKALIQLRKRNYKSTLTSALIETVEHGSMQIEFAPGLTVLCGGNGAGKSTTLGALWKCLVDPEVYTEYRPAAGAAKWISTLSITGTYNGEKWDAAFDLQKDYPVGECPSPVVFIDAAAETGLLLARFLAEDGREQYADLIEGLDADLFSQDQLQLLSYILRRRYERMEIFEVTSFSEEDVATPFFRATSMGMEYVLTAMGRGELCAAYLIWKLSRADRGSIVFLEEPESHLATWSQKALAEAVTAIIVDRGLTVVASSHSPGFFGHLATEHIVLLAASPRPEVRSRLNVVELGRHLGLQPSRAIMVVLEDAVAAEFCRSVLAATDRSLVPLVTFKFSTTGESGVRRIVGDMQSLPEDDFAVAGVLDGDQKDKDGAIDRATYAYLVGDSAPEALLREFTDQWRAGLRPEWEVTLDGGDMRLKLALERLDGEDHHDWLHMLGVEYSGRAKVIDALTSLLLTDSEMMNQAIRFAEGLRRRTRTGN